MKDHIHIQLTDEQFAALQHLAEQKGCTPEEAAVQLIQEQVRKLKITAIRIQLTDEELAEVLADRQKLAEQEGCTPEERPKSK